MWFTLSMYGAGLLIGAVTGWFAAKEYYRLKGNRQKEADYEKRYLEAHQARYPNGNVWLN